MTEQYRRACFNVFAHNRDDHIRNFAFIMNEHGLWRPSPAYDLTFSEGPGGEHSLLVGRDGANPSEEDLIELAQSTDVKHPQVIVDQVRQAVNDFGHHADAAGLKAGLTDQVARVLGTKSLRRGVRKKPPRC